MFVRQPTRHTFVTPTPAVVGLQPGIAGTLAHLLLKGLIAHRLQSAVRRHRINDGGSALVRVRGGGRGYQNGGEVVPCLEGRSE